MAKTRMTQIESEEKKQQFGLWLGLPKEVRTPKTQEELAKQLGTTEQTLCSWAKDPLVLAAKDGALKVLGGNDMYAVIQTIVNKAKEGNYQMARLYMEWQGQVGKQQAAKPEEEKELVIRYGTKERNTD